ncbi:hypothetical protein BGZ61DRAFT_534073 [Ilyonectria robusta]|uniref:uncharacterized protein n=1 Tax=Ilyonectria robusta TaxID=1079257 RepID=UPI001E8E491F|nr:uncharacterized protein BGZ61DRAFT_534073 [Ilyonectria robusta]KAH8686547.1 hypothetical protein BGZ61DRAFT_534073 [Ilyonectria robusta]
MAWCTFEQSIPYFLRSVFPLITIPKAHRARSKLQFIMAEYFTPEHDLNDPSTAQLVMNRANAPPKHYFMRE